MGPRNEAFDFWVSEIPHAIQVKPHIGSRWGARKLTILSEGDFEILVPRLDLDQIMLILITNTNGDGAYSELPLSGPLLC